MLTLLAVLSFGAAWSAPRAEARVEFEAAVIPNVIDYPETRRLRYELRMQTAAKEKTFNVTLVPPFDFDHSRAGFLPLITLISPVVATGPPTFSGAGTFETELSPFPRLPWVPRAPFDVFCHRGPTSAPDGNYQATVTMPARSAATLSFPYAIGRTPPWPDTDFRAYFAVHGLRANVNDPVTQTPQPTFAGLTGVDIDLRLEQGEVIGAGQRRMVIRGETRPRLNREWIGLRVERVEPRGKTRFLGGARTDARGDFRFVWRARRNRLYEITASYNSQSPEFADDRTCPRSAGVDWSWP